MRGSRFDFLDKPIYNRSMNKSILDQLKILSHSGSHPKVWIAAALVYRNKIISYGVNQMKSHPYQMRYGRNPEAIYWHAETSAIFTADKKLGFDKFKNSSLYIARVKYDSSDKIKFISGLAAPCEGCLRCIMEYGIKEVIYTLDEIDNVKEHYGVIVL
jgi:deoxycytidylate deaminase